MNAIMLSIQPKYCELIASGKKTVEVRKTRPKLEVPFKCYIYATVGAFRDVYKSVPQEPLFLIQRKNEPATVAQSIAHEIIKTSEWHLCNGKVIGEFVCDKIEQFTVGSLRCDDIEELACLSHKEMLDYFYKPNEFDGKTVKFGYCWYISDLKIYDTPKELGEFRNLQGQQIKRSFQSWGYVCSKE